jgi:hypothetical protein
VVVAARDKVHGYFVAVPEGTGCISVPDSVKVFIQSRPNCRYTNTSDLAEMALIAYGASRHEAQPTTDMRVRR